MDALGCPLRVEVEVDGSEETTSLPAGLFAILNGGTFFFYIPCVLIFTVLWKWCGKQEGGREYLVEVCFGKGQSADAAIIAEKIGVGAAAAVGLLFSIGNLIAAGVSENCGTTEANAFIALNVLITLANVIACTQVSVIYYGGLKKCLKRLVQKQFKWLQRKLKNTCELDELSSSVSSCGTELPLGKLGHSIYRISSKISALLIIRHPLPNDSLIFRQRSSCVYAINGNGMRTQTEC